MSPSHAQPPSRDPAAPRDPAVKRPEVHTHTPRPDELSRETFEFIAAIDEFKRRRMRSFLEDKEVLHVLHDLGYARALVEDEDDDDGLERELTDFAAERERYRREKGRLFPTWSEVFQLLLELGYARRDESSAA
jgi:hypothetical protein